MTMIKLNSLLQSFDSLHKCNSKSYMFIMLLKDGRIVDVMEYNAHYSKVQDYKFYDVTKMYEPIMEDIGIIYRIAIQEPV